MKPKSSKSRTALPDEVGSALFAMCEESPSPRAITVYMMVKYGEWDQLVSLTTDPNHYPFDWKGALRFGNDAQLSALLKKCEDIPTSFDRKAVAEETFVSCERECYRANARLFPYLYDFGLTEARDEAMLAFFADVRKETTWLLGKCPDTSEHRALLSPDGDWEPVRGQDLDGRFGPGATYGDSGKLTTVPDKMSSFPTMTHNAWPYLFPWAGTHWSTACVSYGRNPTVVLGNRFTTVPKDCRRDRGIAIEPSINVFFQLAYGSVMKRRLRLRGFDLREAQDIHKRVACEASKEGHLATVDFRNASDTVCRALVELCLPEDWFSVLDCLRSPKTEFKGKPWILEKFSSMGNGFTFELETVIILAVSRVITRKFLEERLGDVLVFGDDLIVPTEVAHTIVQVLKFCGLTANVQKSFVSGPFRESCGGDFFLGWDVRPFHLKKFPVAPEDLITFANGLSRFANANRQLSRWSFVRKAWFRILDAIPSHIRCLRGPEALGDIVIHEENQHLWQHRWRSCIRFLKCYRPARFIRVSFDHFKPEVVLASALYGVGDGGIGPINQRSYPGLVPRDAVTGYKVGWVPYS